MSNKKVIFGVLLFIAFIIIAIFALSFKLTILESLRFVLGSVYILFLPGYIWSFILLKKQNLANRIIISFGLSFVMSPLLVFLLSKLGVKITLLSSVVEISLLIIIGLIILFIKEFALNKNAK
ncbi:MAG: hypothetical protein PHN19_01005 [Patescibacteria group bacterium]|nr:hypothetical protein [Patescibacteria group bacterium]